MGQLSAVSASSSLIRQVKMNEPEAWERLPSLCAPSLEGRWVATSKLERCVMVFRGTD